MTEGGLLIFLGILILFVIIVAVIAVVAAVSGPQRQLQMRTKKKSREKESYRTKCVDENRFQALKIKG